MYNILLYTNYAYNWPIQITIDTTCDNYGHLHVESISPSFERQHFSAVVCLLCILAGHKMHFCYYASRHSHSVKIQPSITIKALAVLHIP